MTTADHTNRIPVRGEHPRDPESLRAILLAVLREQARDDLVPLIVLVVWVVAGVSVVAILLGLCLARLG